MAQSITPITWNVVGLDSNNVTVGPNVFPIGARICNNTGSATTGTTWQAKFNWVTTSSYITLTSPSTLSVPSLAPGACQDVFHEVTVSRDAAAYDQKAQYNIEVTDSSGASLTPTAIKTPTNREIYVERLISQNRNAVTGISVDGTPVTLGSGSVSLNEGQIYTIKLDGKTATQGYEQLEQFLGLTSDLFVIKSVRSTYSANAGTDALATTKLYADGCGWQNDRTVTTGSWQYHNNYSCSGTGKYGGVTSVTYVVQVKSGAAAAAAANPSLRTTNALLYDFSGSSYHYNSDFATSAVTFNFATTPPPVQIDLAMAKTAALINSGNGTFTLSVTNTSGTTATGVTVTDTLPNGYDFKPLNSQNAAPAGTTLTWTPNSNSARTLSWNIGSLGAGQTISYTVSVSTNSGQTNYVNEACVTGSQTDPNSSNNCANAQVPEALADLAISKVASVASPNVGDTVTFTVNVTNLGPNTATGVVVNDAVPNGYTVTSSVPSTGTSYASPTWTIGSLALNATATLTINSRVNSSGSYVNTATVSSSSSDPVSDNNSATADATPTYLALTKTTSDTFPAGATNKTFTVTASKTGTASLGTITVQDVVPTGMTLVSMAGTGWSCNSGAGPCTRTDDITATSGFPIAYPAIIVTVNVASTPPSSLTNTSFVYSSLVPSAYAQAQRSVSTTGMTIDATDDGSTTLVPAATGSTSIDLLANDTYNSSAVSVGSNISAPTLQSNGGLTGASIVGNQLQVPNNAAPGTYTLTYRICSISDPNLCDTAIKTVVVPAADVQATLTGFSTPVLPGATVTGTATCTNIGSVAALNATCALTGLPASATVSCTPTSPQASLAAGASMVCSVSYTAPASGSTVITVTTAADNDGNPANNTASTTVAVNVPTAEVQASISGFNSPALPGATVTGTATCTNTSAFTAFNATCALTGLPAGASVSCTPTSPQASLAAGATMICSVSYTAPASGSTVITVTTSADNDGNPANNTASATVAVDSPTLAPIPTLSEWALLFLASLMGLFAVGRMRRQD